MKLLGALLVAFAALPLVAAKPGGMEHSRYGVTKAGEAVDRYVLRNAHGATVGVLTWGGVIDEISVPDRGGHFANVALALPNLAAYEARPNFGSIVGRFANRISHGGFTLDGRYYPLSKDPNAVVSHGGVPSFSARVWRAEPCATPGCASLKLHYLSADGENGFPGALDVTVTYSLADDDTLRIDYQATTTKPTVINLTHHGYYNLAGGTSGSVDAQTIQILASAYTPGDARRVPTGEVRPVAGGPFDLRRPIRIGDGLTSSDPQIVSAKGYDHNFVLDRPAGGSMPVAARAYDSVSGRTLEMSTTEPGVQLYTANSFDGTLEGAGGKMLRQGAGFALETQHFPDSPNQPSFPSTVLRPGQTFLSTTTFHFGIRERP